MSWATAVPATQEFAELIRRVRDRDQDAAQKPVRRYESTIPESRVWRVSFWRRFAAGSTRTSGILPTAYDGEGVEAAGPLWPDVGLLDIGAIVV
jgi:hypothetical protein